jgi:CMP/dCMP kinase
MNKFPPVITIDGPSGSGKGTIGRLLAQILQWHFLDSGVFYRGLALKMIEEGVSLENTSQLASLAQKLDLHVTFSTEGKVVIYLNTTDVTQVILSETCGNRASQIAVFPEIRAALLQKQRDFCKPPGLVADGRDMGSVVFPDADLKIFLSASLEERAIRRYSQLKAQGINVSLDSIKTELALRDDRDSQRKIAPLKSAQDAVVVDTTGLGVEKVRDHVVSLVRQRLGFIKNN